MRVPSLQFSPLFHGQHTPSPSISLLATNAIYSLKGRTLELRFNRTIDLAIAPQRGPRVLGVPDLAAAIRAGLVEVAGLGLAAVAAGEADGADGRGCA